MPFSTSEISVFMYDCRKIMFLFMAPFLAMAKLKQAWLSPSVLTKTFLFIKSVSEIMTIAYGFFRLHIKKNAPPSTATHLA